MSRVRTHPGLVAWAEATEACLELMRTGIRARNPGIEARQIEVRLRQRLEERRRDKLRDYRRHA